MSCTELLRTQAFLDGELDEKASAEAEAHIRECPECQSFSAEAAEMSDALHRAPLRYRAPEALRSRISAALDAEERAKVVPLRRRVSGGFWLGATSGIGGSALAAGFAFVAMLPPSTGIADSVVEAHTRALMDGQTIQVVSSNHHTVKPWFAGRAPLSPPVANFAAQGFPLAGGRLDQVGRAQAAVVVYRHGSHEIDLFVWADHGSPLPHDTTVRGYHTMFWKKGDLDFAAVSDTDAAELGKFSALVRGEPQ